MGGAEVPQIEATEEGAIHVDDGPNEPTPCAGPTKRESYQQFLIRAPYNKEARYTVEKRAVHCDWDGSVFACPNCMGVNPIRHVEVPNA